MAEVKRNEGSLIKRALSRGKTRNISFSYIMEEIEKIDEDVSLFTDTSLKLKIKSSSKPRLETKEEFYEN
jgi:hypothetical protein